MPSAVLFEDVQRGFEGRVEYGHALCSCPVARCIGNARGHVEKIAPGCDAFQPFDSLVNDCCDAPSEVSLIYRNRAVDRICLKPIWDGPQSRFRPHDTTLMRQRAA
ncbi:hypothetical protein EMIT0111MI5_30139 [Burkholderia sp. IT-111MI5]